MKNSNIRGYLEIDHDRGVIYFHAEKSRDQEAFGGLTILRMGGLPKPVPKHSLDVFHMFGQNWGGEGIH